MCIWYVIMVCFIFSCLERVRVRVKVRNRDWVKVRKRDRIWIRVKKKGFNVKLQLEKR